MNKKQAIEFADLTVRADTQVSGGGAVRDWLVDRWDGISFGLASVGWGEGGSIDTLTDALG